MLRRLLIKALSGSSSMLSLMVSTVSLLGSKRKTSHVELMHLARTVYLLWGILTMKWPFVPVSCSLMLLRTVSCITCGS